LGYISVAQSMGLTSTTVMKLVPKGEKKQSIGHYAVQGHQFRYEWKADMQLSMCQ